MDDDLEFDLKVACCRSVAQRRRDDHSTRLMYIASAMGRILADEHVDLDRRGDCRAVLEQFFTADDVDAMLNVAIVAARECNRIEKGAVQ